MAQDFGDESGEMLLRALKRSIIPISKKLFNHFKNQTPQDNLPTPTSHQAPRQVSEVQPSGYWCLPFGDTDNTSDFKQKCSENGLNVIGLTDNNHNGFIFFESHNYTAIEKLVPSFLKENNIDIEDFIHHQNSIEPMSEEEMIQIFSLIREVGDSPRAPEGVKEVQLNKTQGIAREVTLAQNKATNFEEFRSILEKQGIGIATSVKGENLFYEARRADDGSLLPYSREQRDWAVSAETLKTKYGVDATDDWFNDKMPSTDGSMDTRGETADLNQGIESHDGMDTNTSTLRIEREATGTDIAPSVTRKTSEQATPQYSLSSEAKSMRQASKQLSKGHGIEDKVTDISDKLNPMR